MPTHLYCLLPANSAGPGTLAGIGESPVRVLRAGALDAWVSTVDGAPSRDGDPAAVVAAARAHDAVVAAALASGTTPLHVRLGQHLADDAECVATLARREGALLAQLARVRDHVEMTLVARLPLPDESTPSAAPVDARGVSPAAHPGGAGRAYLEQVKAALTMERNLQLRVAAVRRRVTETVGALVRDEVVQVQPPPSATLSLSHLVPRASVAAYRDAAAGLAADPDVPSLVLIGPLAPYRFAEVPRE
jgi:hypothetical protein